MNEQKSTESDSQSCHDIDPTDSVCSQNKTTVVNELNQCSSGDDSSDFEQNNISPMCEYPAFYQEIVHLDLPETEQFTLIRSKS